MPAIVEAISERTVTITGPRVKRWTVDEFYKLTEMGYLLPSFSMLLDGDIFELPLPTPPHVMSVTLTEGAMRERFAPAM